MYIHQDWPRDLIHKATGKRQEFKRPEDVPIGGGWFTVDGEEVNPRVIGAHKGPPPPVEPIGAHIGPLPKPEPLATTEAQDDASEQALRAVSGGGSDAKPRGKRRGRGHSEPVGSDPSVSDVEESG